jgi:tetratricopeptide (TPR) repeat protein
MFRPLVIGAALALLVFAPAATPQEAGEGWKKLIIDASYAEGAHDYPTAEQIYLKALHEAERFGPADVRVGTTLSGLCGAYLAATKMSEATNACRRALVILESTNGAESIEVAEVNFKLARAAAGQDRYADALPLTQTALATYVRLLGGASLKTADVLCTLGDAYRALKSFREAEAPLRRCADIRETQGGIQNPALADALHSLALTYVGQGRYELAEPRFKLAEKIRESALGITSPLLARTLEDHAASLQTIGRLQEARELLKMATAIRRTRKK